MGGIIEIAKNVVRIPSGIANSYIVGTKRSWALVDTGTAGNADKIWSEAKGRFGTAARPEAILLTHGHFDHAGSAAELADSWRVPVLAHRLELPYLTGRSKYPPPDPTVGGFMANVVRFLPNKTYDLGDRVSELDIDNLPGMRGWTCLETPGHSPGHVSLYRAEDDVLLAGDAFITANQQSFLKLVTKAREICPPPIYYTCDWQSARRSIRTLADLDPRVIGAGHGEPMSGRGAARQLRRLADDFPIPQDGRYVREPARADESGIVYLPPPVPDRVARGATIAAGAAAAGILGVAAYRRKRDRAA